jgi:hypothetical protein
VLANGVSGEENQGERKKKLAKYKRKWEIDSKQIIIHVSYVPCFQSLALLVLIIAIN